MAKIKSYFNIFDKDIFYYFRASFNNINNSTIWQKEKSYMIIQAKYY